MAQYPALAGKKADLLVQALKDFKSGKRDNVFMKGMASSLSDQDIENVGSVLCVNQMRLCLVSSVQM